MINGIIFLENGDVQIIGTLNTVRGIADAINKTIPTLIAQERKQLLASVTDDELKQIIEMKSIKSKE